MRGNRESFRCFESKPLADIFTGLRPSSEKCENVVIILSLYVQVYHEGGTCDVMALLESFSCIEHPVKMLMLMTLH